MEEEKQPQSIDVLEVLSMMADQLASICWAKLGLQPDPISGTLALNLEQARIAIDAFASLAPVLKSQLSTQDQASVDNIVRDLKLNYVSKSKEAKG